jgi:hypothetical protein
VQARAGMVNGRLMPLGKICPLAAKHASRHCPAPRASTAISRKINRLAAQRHGTRMA